MCVPIQALIALRAQHQGEEDVVADVFEEGEAAEMLQGESHTRIRIG